MVHPYPSHEQGFKANRLSGAEVDERVLLARLLSAQTLSEVYILVVPAMMDGIREIDLLPSRKDEVTY